jgi:hypothetical protein
MVTLFACALHLNPQGENAQRHLSELYRPVEALLQLGLYLTAILVDVNQMRKCKESDDYDDNEDNNNNCELSHGLFLPSKWMLVGWPSFVS